MKKNKHVYGFEILDNDYREIQDKGFMLYTIKNDLLTPVIREFENSGGELFSSNTMLECLNYNNIKELVTYAPDNYKTVCSAPYETEEGMQGETEKFDNDYRFHHIEISLTKEQKTKLKENNIKLIYLNDKEINDLEKSLRDHY